MKIITAIDSFKGSMTSMEAGQAAAEGILRVDADAEVIVRPLADGGEGTVEALVSGMNGTLQKVQYRVSLSVYLNIIITEKYRNRYIKLQKSRFP